MNRILFFEGVPGVGKTTMMNKLLHSDAWKTCPCVVYSSDVLPVNWVRKEIKCGRSLTVEEARVIYRARPYHTYFEEHIEIWKTFCDKNADLQNDFLVDAGLIQATLYELLGLYMLSNADICYHVQCILDVVGEAFIPQLIYLETDHPALCIRTAIETQGQQRKQWVDGFCRWLEIAPYPMAKKYTGAAGIERFVEDRHCVDRYLLDHLAVDKKLHHRENLHDLY